MQILVPLAGRSSFFPEEHYFFPKSLIEVGGRTMIERVVENLSRVAEQTHFIFVVQHDDVSRFSLARTLELLTGGRCHITALRAPTKGALCSALLAVDNIDMAQPLIIANGDQVILADLARAVKEFQAAKAHAGVIVFDSVHPRWSYVDLGPDCRVAQAAEKQVISRNAIAGFYYFATGATFFEAAKRCIENKTSLDGQFYIAPCLNEVILAGADVASYRVPATEYHSFYSPEKIKQFEDGLLRRSLAPSAANPMAGVRVVIPAAGDGSRFRKAGFVKPKPFIDVLGRPMIEHVVDNVASARSRVHLLLRNEHVTGEAELVERFQARGYAVHTVDKLTEGTACTLLLARQAIDDDTPMLVANSDQYVEFSVDAFVGDCLDRDLDGSILVFRDPSRNPKWSFARLNGEGLVCEVAEKKPISDLATVGIYFFRRGSDFVRGAIDMIARNDRVNNEFYTCPVYNYLIQRGLRIGVFEVSQNAMHGLGTPEDLADYITLKTAVDVPVAAASETAARS